MVSLLEGVRIFFAAVIGSLCIAWVIAIVSGKLEMAALTAEEDQYQKECIAPKHTLGHFQGLYRNLYEEELSYVPHMRPSV